VKACTCGSTRIAPSNLRAHHYICGKCIYQTRIKKWGRKHHHSETGRARIARYATSAKGKAKAARSNQKRMKLGGRTIYFPTLEATHAARALVKRRRAAFLQEQHESQQG
jgi:hypothetical protein